ncbi:MAG: gfo/Idh/MocA family oxidoreductase, partial [Chloroflexota bacterium]
AHWCYANGVHGVLGAGAGIDTVGVSHRLVGTTGTIEVGVPGGPLLRVRHSGGAWETIDTGGETLHGPGYHQRAIADTIDALLTGRKPELSADSALNATEIIFAIYESSRRRARIDLPLSIQDNPLAAMVERGDLCPSPAQ